MGTRVFSSRLVVATSFAALVVFIWGVLLDWHFVIGEWGFTFGQLGMAALIYTALISGWIWALTGARGGSQRAVYALLVYALLVCAYALQDLFAYCPATCPKIWLYYIANWGNLLAGVTSAAEIVMNLRISTTP